MTDPTSLPNFPPPADEHPLRGRVLDVLVDVGLAPNIDDDGDVAVTVNDQQLFVRCVDAEAQVMRVFGQWAIQEDLREDVVRLLEQCNNLNLHMNCVKTGITNNTLVVTSEHLITPGADLSALVQISLQIVLQTVHLWHQQILGIAPADPEAAPDGPEEPS